MRDLGLREFRVDAGGGLATAASCTRGGTISTASTARFSASGRRILTARIRSWCTATIRSVPQCVFQARPIPDSHKLIFTATAHHSITGGSLVLLDRTRGTEFERPLDAADAGSLFPGDGRLAQVVLRRSLAAVRAVLPGRLVGPPLAAPYLDAAGRSPESAQRLRDLPVRRLWQFDASAPRPGDLQRHADSASPHGTPPPVVPDAVDWAGRQEGEFLVQDIYQGLGDVPRGRFAACGSWACRRKSSRT